MTTHTIPAPPTITHAPLVPLPPGHRTKGSVEAQIAADCDAIDVRVAQAELARAIARGAVLTAAR